MTEIRITHGMVERATCAMIAEMFAPHELPLDDDLWDKYYQTAKVALTAALSEDDIEKCPKCNSDNWPSVNWKNGKSYAYCPDCGHVEQS
jgi:late competence protein required for DNA uptake (superfamily II DNA/RNA helicase)